MHAAASVGVKRKRRRGDVPRERGSGAPYGILRFDLQRGSGGDEGREARCGIEKEVRAAPSERAPQRRRGSTRGMSAEKLHNSVSFSELYALTNTYARLCGHNAERTKRPTQAHSYLSIYIHILTRRDICCN